MPLPETARQLPKRQCARDGRANNMRLKIEFGGGVEALFGGDKRREVTLDSTRSWTVGDLLAHMRDAMVKERPELFLQGDTIRPGILVLVNDTDWELLGELACELRDGDTVVFISTLHGG